MPLPTRIAAILDQESRQADDRDAADIIERIARLIETGVPPADAAASIRETLSDSVLSSLVTRIANRIGNDGQP